MAVPKQPWKLRVWESGDFVVLSCLNVPAAWTKAYIGVVIGERLRWFKRSAVEGWTEVDERVEITVTRRFAKKRGFIT